MLGGTGLCLRLWAARKHHSCAAMQSQLWRHSWPNPAFSTSSAQRKPCGSSCLLTKSKCQCPAFLHQPAGWGDSQSVHIPSWCLLAVAAGCYSHSRAWEGCPFPWKDCWWVLCCTVFMIGCSSCSNLYLCSISPGAQLSAKGNPPGSHWDGLFFMKSHYCDRWQQCLLCRLALYPASSNAAWLELTGLTSSVRGLAWGWWIPQPFVRHAIPIWLLWYY